ncbi:MAG: glycosyltransferase [Clostridiales bacterium]|nr:MAG: glycosyltransferase [Clostridiales bacterium]
MRACVESVCKMCGDDAEIIIIDDCSTYNCSEIVSEYAQSDGRIRLLRFGRKQRNQRGAEQKS